MSLPPTNWDAHESHQGRAKWMVLVVSFSWPNLMANAITFVNWSPDISSVFTFEYSCKLISSLFQPINKQGRTLQLRPIERVEQGPPQQWKWLKGPDLNAQCIWCSFTQSMNKNEYKHDAYMRVNLPYTNTHIVPAMSCPTSFSLVYITPIKLGFMIQVEVSESGGTPKAGWFISWKIQK